MFSINYIQKSNKYFFVLIITIFFLTVSSVTGFAQNCNTDLPSIRLVPNKANLTPDAQKILAVIAEQMKSNPGCGILITAAINASKSGQSNCEKRMETIKKFLVEKQGINSDRIITECTVNDKGENVNITDFRWNN